MTALHTMGDVILHVVAQVIESVFVIGAVRDVGAVGSAALRIVQIVHNHADTHAQSAIERAHPFRVAPRQIVVYGDDVYAAASQRVQRSEEHTSELQSP